MEFGHFLAARKLPLGGFVSSRDGGEDDTELFGASHGKRTLILSAGSLFNILFAFVIFIPVSIIGSHFDPVSALLMSTKTVWEILSGTLLFLLTRSAKPPLHLQRRLAAS